MCGIFFSLSRTGHVIPDTNTQRLLRNRGPDSTGQHQTIIESSAKGASTRLHATFLSTVLALRGNDIVEQPLRDDTTGSVLCWNGEAWSFAGQAIDGNDSKLVFTKLLDACTGTREASMRGVIELLSVVRGPYALVFYDASHKRIYYGRDCLGRRSLLQNSTPDGTLVLSSVCDDASGESWAEVEADGIYVVDLELADPTSKSLSVTRVPHRRSDQEEDSELSFTLPFPAMNQTVDSSSASQNTGAVEQLRASLERSLQLRTQHIREAVTGEPKLGGSRETRVAVLFSGGLDCTILARMCHDLLPLSEPVDLLNVAFENPRIHSNLEPNASPYELCPDRVTGRSSLAELVEICSGREWRFVEVNVPYTETQAHRGTVMALMHPHNTEMDLSISYALYFASRGVGFSHAAGEANVELYSTTAHVLLSGLGADELFGGYQRHATAFARRGYPGLIEELELDFSRLGKRNLGRDDRVISNSSREVRFPFLDEDFIALTLRLSVTSKCDFGLEQVTDSEDPAQLLEPGKRALRLLAWHLGMKRVATEKKRAIQFGARTAKMETGKTKGTHVLSQ
ncbi:asparagine synthase-domain-containing protein [Alternaria rosae]|uniref:asparagine synthase-domain-containing protein n=1 Tax=Alternaria rosae TaxID=1187941 RepID=UPI001E8DB145|nr:asparagine synthase-domain-containing protein [Alternaria rosae]KAH6883035.1 asparagine synthase-domain-containing protein [Alternaria rosae]